MGFTVDIKGNASHLDKTLKGVEKSLSNLGSVATTGLKSLAGIGVAGGAAMIAFIVASSKAAADVEDLGIQFEVLTGSAKTAAELMKTFREEEEKSALNLSDYANAAKTILAFGTSVDDVTPTLRMIGDVSMGNSERFGSLALAFAQTTAAGRLMGQEVLQFVNAGFNPLEQISRDTGRSMQDLKKDMEDGAITVDMVNKAFVSATSEGGRFYKAIDKGSASTNAKLNQLDAAVTRLQVAFGTGFNDGLKDALDATNTFLPQLQDKFSTAGSMLGGAIREAIAGNTEQLAAAGALLGEVVFEGFKSFYMKSMDELLAGAQNLGSTESDAMRGMVNKLSNKMGRGDVYKAGEIGNKSTAAPLSSYMQNAMENVQGSGSLGTLQAAQMKRDIAAGIKTGITSSMSEEVKKGILDAWAKQPQGAKFSN
jgi:tape measure domain-containing protein